MPATLDDLEDRLDRIEAGQEKLLSIVVRHERRLEAMHQEFLRAVTILYRLKLASDGAKAAAQRRADAIDEIARRLGKIEEKIAGRKS